MWEPSIGAQGGTLTKIIHRTCTVGFQTRLSGLRLHARSSTAKHAPGKMPQIARVRQQNPSVIFLVAGWPGKITHACQNRILFSYSWVLRICMEQVVASQLRTPGAPRVVDLISPFCIIDIYLAFYFWRQPMVMLIQLRYRCAI